MKPHPPPDVPGNTEAEKFDNAVRKMFSVSKDAFLKADEQYRRQRRIKPTKKPAKKADCSPA
jgi:hypothetical protein